MIIDELIAILGYDLRGEGELARFNAGLDRTESRARAVAGRINAMSVAVGTFIGSIASNLALRVADTIGSLPGDILDVGKQFEGYQIRLETLLGSQEKANEALEWIQNFAKTTPLEIADVTDAYANLVNYGLDPTTGSLQAITDAMAGSGKGVETLNRLTLALGQAWVKQKLQGGEILQLTEAGIPVWDMLAQATGKNVQELQKLSEKGKLGRKEIQLLIDAIGKKYAGASAKFARTMQGITSNLSDNWTQFLKRIADAGFYDAVKDRLQGVLDKVNEWAADGTLDRWAKRISNALVGALSVMETVFGRIGTHIGAIIDLFGSLDTSTIYALAAAFAWLLVSLFPVTSTWVLLAAAIDDFLTYLEGGESKIGDFIKWIQELTGASEGLSKAIAGVVAGLGLLMALRVKATLGALGRFFLGMGGSTAAGAAGATAATSPSAAAGAGYLARAVPWLAALGSMLMLKGDTTDSDANMKAYQESDEFLDDLTKIKGWDRKGPTSRGGRSKYTRAGGRSSTESAFGFGGPAAPEPDITTRARENQGDGGSIAAMLAGMNANIQKLAGKAEPGAVITDASQDNRSYPVTVNSSVVQNVALTQASAAAAAAVAAGTAAAVGQAAVPAASRMERDPSF
jgi:tape measure domain-containing protein